MSLGTTNLQEAEARQQRVKENIELVKNGRLTLPEDADIGEFLLSDGKLDGKPVPKAKLRILRLFKEAFWRAFPKARLKIALLVVWELTSHIYSVCWVSLDSSPG